MGPLSRGVQGAGSRNFGYSVTLGSIIKDYGQYRAYIITGIIVFYMQMISYLNIYRNFG